MAGNSPAVAVREQTQFLQQAISCVTNAVLVQTGDYRHDRSLGLTLSGGIARLESNHLLGFSLRLEFHVLEERQARRRWNLQIAAYEYRLLDRHERELFAYHWHPDSRSPVIFSHLHVAQAGGEYARLLSKAHFPTGPIALQDVLRLIITDFGVRPRREDWASVLDAASRVSP